MRTQYYSYVHEDIVIIQLNALFITVSKVKGKFDVMIETFFLCVAFLKAFLL
jgi:CRISPR/Cas system CMR-associated protein Cmr5 small subunit